MDYQWYPGHMTKAMRQMSADIKLVDLVIELLDARIPMSSRNPDIDKLAEGKSRLVILGKADLADDKITKKWIEYFEKSGIYAIKIDSRKTDISGTINNAVSKVCAKKIERDEARGIKNRAVKAMVVGIPNVGKSTFINSYAKKSVAKTGNKPGVTKGKQWIRMGKLLELLDTPGVLWPKFDDRQTGVNLALIGSMNDNNLDMAELAFELMKILDVHYEDTLKDRYEIDTDVTDNPDGMLMADPNGARALAIIERIGQKRGCLVKGGVVDTTRASKIVIDDFRAGRLGNITLDFPQE